MFKNIKMAPGGSTHWNSLDFEDDKDNNVLNNIQKKKYNKVTQIFS